MRLPSFSVKLRTQPTWSLRSPPSMRLASTTSCHWSWLLKSRSTAQTRSIGASMTVERTTCCSTAAQRPPKCALQRVEAALEHAAADRLGQLALARLVAVELGAPFGEAARAVGDRRELQRGDVVLDAHRALEDLVGAAVVVVGQRQQPLADRAAVARCGSGGCSRPGRSAGCSRCGCRRWPDATAAAPLKSRMRDQTLSALASMTLET